MRREVVEHHVDLQFLWNVQVNEIEEGEHILRCVTGLDVIEHVTGRHVRRGEQVSGGVTLLVVGHRGAATLLHGQ